MSSSSFRSVRAASPRKAAVAAALQSSESIGARLEELERKVERLRSLYESFFLGSERRAPHVPRQELNRLMLEMQQLSIRNAALRFRFQTLAQRWTLLTTYWNRVLREMESGTYRRDLQKAFRRTAARGAPLTEDDAVALGIPPNRAKAFVAQQNRRHHPDGGITSEAAPQVQPLSPTCPVPSAPSAPPVVPTPRAGAADEHQLGALYRAYVAEHQRLQLAGPPPSEDRLRAKLLPHLERLRAAYPAVRLDVTIVAEGGRLVLKAKPSV